MLQYIFFDVAVHIFCDVTIFIFLMLHLRTDCVRNRGQGRDGERDPMKEQGAVEDGVPWKNWVQWRNGEGERGGKRE